MELRLEKVIQVAPYETMRFDIRITDIDVPKANGDTLDMHANKMHERAYLQVVAWLVFHKQWTREQAITEMKRFRASYPTKNEISK